MLAAFDGFSITDLCDDIQLVCSTDFSMDSVFKEFARRGIVFDSEQQVGELLPLIMELSNNTRLWENNGYIPKGMHDLTGKLDDNIAVKEKPGRNDSCPCGSGLKYKKCCLGKE